MKTKFIIQQILIVAIILLLPIIVHADVPGFGDDTSDAPIDGGLSLLIAGGVGYGIKKVKQGKSKIKQID